MNENQKTALLATIATLHSLVSTLEQQAAQAVTAFEHAKLRDLISEARDRIVGLTNVLSGDNSTKEP